MSSPLYADATIELLDVSDVEVVETGDVGEVLEVMGDGQELSRSQIAADILNRSSSIGAAVIDTVEAASTVAPTGAWDFDTSPTVNGSPIQGLTGPATPTVLGGIQLAGDLGGSAAAPQVTSGSHHTHTPAQAGAISSALQGAANGIATLGADGKLNPSQVPALSISDFLGVVGDQVSMLGLTGQRGDWATRSDLGADFILIADDSTQLSSWRQITSPGSSSISPTYSNLPAGLVCFVVQTSPSGAWGNRPTSRTDLKCIWIRTVTGSANPAAATSPAVNGAYSNDLVVGV
jgi:hypothetical protein